MIEPSVSKSVAKVDSPQAFLCKFVQVFLRATVFGENFDPYSTLPDGFRKKFDYQKLRQGEFSKEVTEEMTETLPGIHIFHQFIE